MLNDDEVKQLIAQKQLLVAESELNRQAIRTEFNHLRSTVGQVATMLPAGRSTMLLLAPLAGFLVSGKSKPWKGWLKKVMLGWQLFRVVKRVVAAFSSRAPGAGEAPPAEPEAR